MTTRKGRAGKRRGQPKPTKPDAKRGGADGRAEAMRMLAEGYIVTHVATKLGVHRTTVAEWRDSPEGQRELDAARAVVSEKWAAELDATRGILRAAARRAAQTLADTLESTVPFERGVAANGILNRVGMPETKQVETTTRRELDLSKLTQEEIDTLEQITAKARMEGT